MLLGQGAYGKRKAAFVRPLCDRLGAIARGSRNGAPPVATPGCWC